MKIRRSTPCATRGRRGLGDAGALACRRPPLRARLVIESRGFTPRKPGAHMLVAEDGETCGTIGGGAIEQQVLVEARALLEGGGSSLVRKHLTQELGMCCGGEMAVFLEVLEPAPRLLLFGAGYIGRALAALAAGCGFDVTVVDERPSGQSPSASRTAACSRSRRGLPARQRHHRRDYAVVVTHDHALDQRLVQSLLERPLKFVGMIGSVPKQRKFALRLRARGFSDAQIARCAARSACRSARHTRGDRGERDGRDHRHATRRLGRRGLDAAAPQGRARDAKSGGEAPAGDAATSAGDGSKR